MSGIIKFGKYSDIVRARQGKPIFTEEFHNKYWKKFADVYPGHLNENGRIIPMAPDKAFERLFGFNRMEAWLKENGKPVKKRAPKKDKPQKQNEIVETEKTNPEGDEILDEVYSDGEEKD